MSTLFNMDNPLWRGLGKVADLMILNIVFIICCIPIFTIGASLTALNYVTLKMHDGEEGYIVRSFFRSFRQNFKQATGLWAIMLFSGLILVLDIMILRSTEGAFASVLTVIIIIVCIIWFMVFLYLFAVLSRFDNTVKNTLRNSFIMAIADFPRTFLMVLLYAAAVVVTLFNSTTLTWALLFWIMFGFASMSYWCTSFLGKIFHKYAPKEEDDSDPDHWDVDEIMGDGKAVDAVSADTEVTDSKADGAAAKEPGTGADSTAAGYELPDAGADSAEGETDN
ncbi:MAG: YesL family protein [Lachnospiraceae bacterium]|nr:YesL family protein [Lachnospiraceae bacterium]